MFVSTSTGIASLVVFASTPLAASILGFVSGLSQVACSLLLAECIEEAVKGGNIGSISLKRR